MNINQKIRQDLNQRAKPSPKHAAKILHYLIANHQNPVSLSIIAESLRKKSGSIWGAAYDLAANGKIGVADRKYHLFSSNPLLAKLSKKQSIVVWHRKLNVNVSIRPQWAKQISSIQTNKNAISLEPVQPALFDLDAESMSNYRS